MTSCWTAFFWAFPFFLIIAVALSILPILIQQILHASFVEKNAAAIETGVLTMVMLLIIRSLADYGGHYLMRKADNRLCMQLNTALFDKLINLPHQYYQNLNKHHATDTVLTSIKQISHSTVQIITILARDTLIIISLVLFLAWLDQDFALLVLLLIPFAVIMLQIVQSQQNVEPHINTPYFNRLISRLQRSIKNYRLIRLYGGQQQACKRLKNDAQSIQNNDMQQINYKAFVAALCQLVMLLIVVAITYLITQQILKDTFTLAQTGAFVTALLLLIAPVKRLASIPQTLQVAHKNLEQVFSLLDQHTAIDDNDKTLPEIIQGKLTFDHVSFSGQKPEKSILQKINLEIRSGETVAIVCKKKHIRSQIIDLMLGFHQPATGKMLLDDHPFTEIKHADLLAQFAMVSSEPVILNDRIAGNIAYGATKCASEASITAATHSARASTFIREMPDGLQTRVDENGANLTRLQWQHIAIARAMLKNPPILIIENLWLKSDQTSLNEAIVKLTEHRTTIILMDAMPAIRDYIARIFLLEDGVIAEKRPEK
ncbi:ABC transporter ATP-binding protein [Nitrosomonas sp.]|uniref:ABC transporter ATP-binding protein n=1 Tax=Nitrosomonas sp. TaxID=42353 RepID=UPI0025D62062|nr:ABC transporter transmembrane domain-containing protein [Nitrosomonas sp.]